MTVHPHVRGEDRSPSVTSSSALGSPPRAWGRHREDDKSDKAIRFTPTCVGKTSANRTDDLIPAGSPPRAWGRLTMKTALFIATRFTPTCVGKTEVLHRGA